MRKGAPICIAALRRASFSAPSFSPTVSRSRAASLQNGLLSIRSSGRSPETVVRTIEIEGESDPRREARKEAPVLNVLPSAVKKADIEITKTSPKES